MLDLTAELYDAFDTDPAPVAGFLQWLAAAHRLPQAPRVLDVGCGTGRLLGPLAALGWRVTGMEPDPRYRARAAQAGERAGAAVLAGGFNDVEGEGAFDLVVAVNSSFAHLLSAEERADALRRVHRALAPGGVLFLDLPNFLWILRNYRPPEEQVRTAGLREFRLQRQHDIDFHAATFTTHEHFTVTAPGQPAARVEKEHRYAMTALPDLLHLVREAGLREPRTFRGYASRETERVNGARMLVAARRPE
ncbi:MAG TPA: class I SAM-dependent methyltransferase [Longimicrobiaceae bacterium]|nr:class I SAM-dependent methyltransferase [Longimicrobiaceae bacterium]